MKITLFTSNQPRHISLLNRLSQISDKWRSRVGLDWKIHKLNNIDIKDPWLDGSAVRLRFAEYWEDVGLDQTSYLDVEGNQADQGEGNGEWDCEFDDDGNYYVDDAFDEAFGDDDYSSFPVNGINIYSTKN